MVDNSEAFLSSAGIWMPGSVGHYAPEVFVPAWMCFRLLPAEQTPAKVLLFDQHLVTSPCIPR